MKESKVVRRKLYIGIIVVILINAINCLGIANSKKSSSNFSWLALLGGGSSSAATSSGSDSIPTPTPQATYVSQSVSASSGGTITLNNNVSLSIPPNSLSQDTVISIEQIETPPNGDMQGFTNFGKTYQFLPEGTVFDINNPAMLSVKYDPSDLASKGLEPKSMNVMYFDTSSQSYVGVGSYVDPMSQRINSALEHFTDYIFVAQQALPGSGPVVAAQVPIPGGNILADAPIYMRVTAYDTNPPNPLTGFTGGAITGVKVFYRKRYPAVSAYQSTCMKYNPATGTYSATQFMTPEVSVTTAANVHTYGCLIPSTYLNSTTDLGAGNDFEYYFVATNNLNKTTQVASAAAPLGRAANTYQPGSLKLSPIALTNLTIAAGFQRRLTFQANNTLAAVIPAIVPDSLSLNGVIALSDISNQTGSGVVFTARVASPNTPSTDTISGTISNTNAPAVSNTATSTITITNGELASISVLDQFHMPIVGSVNIDEFGTYNKFDVRGYDSFGNTIFLNPDQPSNWFLTGNIFLTPPLPIFPAPISPINVGRIDSGTYSQFSNQGTISVSMGAITSNTANINIISRAFNWYVSTFAGNGTAAEANGIGTSAQFNWPAAVVSDGISLFVSDRVGQTYRKIDIASQLVSTLAGTSGVAGSANGVGSAATFDSPQFMAIDPAGTNLYITEGGNFTIRKINIATGLVTNLAGAPGTSGFVDAVGAAARFTQPQALATDGIDVYVADTGNRVLRKINILSGAVSTVAGAGGVGVTCSDNPIGTAATGFSGVGGMVLVGTNLYFTDTNCSIIRVFDTISTQVTTVAGTNNGIGFTDGIIGSRFNAPYGLTKDNFGNVFVGDSGNSAIRKVIPGTGEVFTLAGNGISGFADGTGVNARFSGPQGIVKVGYSFYVADHSNHRIRKLQ